MVIQIRSESVLRHLHSFKLLIHKCERSTEPKYKMCYGSGRSTREFVRSDCLQMSPLIAASYIVMKKVVNTETIRPRTCERSHRKSLVGRGSGIGDTWPQPARWSPASLSWSFEPDLRIVNSQREKLALLLLDDQSGVKVGRVSARRCFRKQSCRSDLIYGSITRSIKSN